MSFFGFKHNGLILVCQNCTRLKTQKSKGRTCSLVSYLQGWLEVLENQKSGIEMVGTGIDNDFFDFQLFYIGKYRENGKNRTFGHFGPLEDICHAPWSQENNTRDFSSKV